MWGDAGPEPRTDTRRGRSVVVDLVLLAVVPALLAAALAAVVGVDRWRAVRDAQQRRDRLVALDVLAELRSLVTLDELFVLIDPADEAPLATGLGVSATGARSGFDPVVDRLVALDVDGFTGRASTVTVLEAIAGLEGRSASGSGVSGHDVAADRIDAVMVEIADAETIDGRAEADLVRALSGAEQFAADIAALAIDAPTTPAVETATISTVVARLEQTLARLGAELPSAEARRLTATVDPVDVAGFTDGGAAEVAPLVDSAARVGELRALRRDFAASTSATAVARADHLVGQLRSIAFGAALVAIALCALVARLVGRLLGGLGRVDERVRGLAAGELAPTPGNTPPGRELRTIAEALDGIAGALRSVRSDMEVVGEEDRGAVSVAGADRAAAAEPLRGVMAEGLASVEAQLRSLRAREAFAQGLIDTTDEAIFTVDERSLVTWANAAAGRLFSVSVDELTGASVGDLVRHLPLLAELPVGITNADSSVVAGGSVRSVLVSTRLVGDDEHPIVAVFARDISERRELEHQLSHQATHDDLTGLGNRASLVSELDRARARAQRSGQGFGLLFIDLDRFKLVNDTLGHRTGDLVLRRIAERLRSATRGTDFVARNGGDEFVVIAEEATDIGTVVRLADRIQEELAAPLVIEDDAIPVSASIGVTWLDPEDDNSLDQLRNADVAMYQAKSSGPGQVRVFDEDMRNWVEQRFDLERALRRAVGRGELEAFVQPIIDLRTGRVTSAELLSRWTMEDGREIPPDAFIEVAEDSTLVVEIGRWVLDRAAQLLSSWEHDRRLAPIGLSVNLSGRHIDHPNVVADVSDALRRWNADPRLLAIEITETSLLRDLQEAAATLRQLHDIGVSISVDDFGVGYASLRYLRELPVELVKIDRSIVAGFERVDSDTVIVTMLSRLADVLDIAIVAEGVETEEQRERLADIGCHYAQGFLFAPAMAVPEFERWLAQWERQHTHPARWHELLND